MKLSTKVIKIDEFPIIRSSSQWSIEEINLLKSLRAEGYPVAEIVKKFKERNYNRTFTSIETKIRRLRIPLGRKKGWSPDEIEALKELYFSGKTINEISKTLNKTFDSVRYKIKSLGLSSLKKRT